MHGIEFAPVPFRCDVEPEGEVVRITLAGELDLSTASRVEPALRDIRAKKRLLDLRELTFIDSSGLRLILRAHAEARRTGQALEIVPGPPAVQRVFQLCGVEDELSFVEP